MFQQQVDTITTSLGTFLAELGAFLPKLLGAIVVLVLGWLIAKALRFVVGSGLKAVGFGVVTEKAGLDGFLKKGGVKSNTIDVLALLVYWLAILATLLTAFNILGLTVASELFRSVTEFIPQVIVAVLIITIGLYFARFASEAVMAYLRNVGAADVPLVGRVVYLAIAVFSVMIALEQVGIGQMITELFKVLWYGIVAALAIAFGLGGQKWAADQIDKMSKSIKK